MPPDDHNEESDDADRIKIDEDKGKGKRLSREDYLGKVATAVDAIYHQDQDE